MKTVLHRLFNIWPYLASIGLMIWFNIPLYWVIFAFWIEELLSVFFLPLRTQFLQYFTNSSSLTKGAGRWWITSFVLLVVHTPFVIFCDDRVWKMLKSYSSDKFTEHSPVFGFLANGYKYLNGDANLNSQHLSIGAQLAIFFIIAEGVVLLQIMYNKIPKEDHFAYQKDIISGALGPPMMMHFIILFIALSYFMGIGSINYYVISLLILRVILFSGYKFIRPDIEKMDKPRKFEL